MPLNHPALEDLAVFLGNTSRRATQGQNAQVMRHLLFGCAICRERLSAVGWDHRHLTRLLEPGAENAPIESYLALMATDEPDYSRAFDLATRSVSAILSPERQWPQAPAMVLAELDSLPAEEQARRVSAGGSFVAPPVIEALIERSHAIRYQDAEEMLRLANLARLAADACSPAEAGNDLRLADLRTRAWAQYGNALRVLGRPREAEGAFATAQHCRREGTGDPLLRAWLLEKITPLVIFQGRFDDAIEKCEEAGEIYRELGESHLLASTMVQKAIATLYSGEAESAVRVLNQAIPLIDYEEDPHLLLVACHNLIHCYIDLGRPDQALQLYSETKDLYQGIEDPLILLRATWQEGRLLRDLGHLQAAETTLLRARKGYLERKLAYEVALVSLDLATLYVKDGRVEKLKRTVLETVPIFHALRVGLETLASLLQLQQIAGQEQQALELISALSARIEPLRRQRIEEN
ncbi:MAG TPA: tetratricopeptide repeat protein [Thermoanaerobaculia bacterium]|jgi:tetratricopeptide (TPR) repeat protein|nr:tetratricopeptide repeat protein [Thermoanaerobaculia bacterium]